ncbi:MAG: hypothetical protein R2725_11530 [Solirubrobacterales bacterium]
MSAVAQPPGGFVVPGGLDPVVLVVAVGAAEGSRAAAAALACAGASGEQAPLLIDLEGRPPRPTLLATAAAQQLEERLVAHLPAARIAARGQLCQAAVGADRDGLAAAAAAAAATVARGAPVVVHVEAPHFRDLLEGAGPQPTAVLLRADIRDDRALLGLLVRELREAGIAVGVLKRRLGWVTERRALFGALGSEQAAALTPQTVARLMVPREASVA